MVTTPGREVIQDGTYFMECRAVGRHCLNIACLPEGSLGAAGPSHAKTLHLHHNVYGLFEFHVLELVSRARL